MIETRKQKFWLHLIIGMLSKPSILLYYRYSSSVQQPIAGRAKSCYL